MTAQTPKRYRGFILTPAGLEKLHKGIRQLELQTKIQCSARRLSEQVQLISPNGIHPGTIRKILRGRVGVDYSSIALVYQVLQLDLQERDYAHARKYEEVARPNAASAPKDAPKSHHGDCNWGEATDVSVFYGRERELAQLEGWVVGDHCRLVAILGMGGIGKTALSVKFAQQVQHQFDYVIWRSLTLAPPVIDILIELNEFLSKQEVELPSSVDGLKRLLINYLRQSRCLLILDNAEAILCSGKTGVYRQGYEEYSELFQCVGETFHSSCLILTSREKPKEIASLEGATLPVRSLQIGGLSLAAGMAILKAKGLNGLEKDLSWLSDRYAGNPLALKIVATTVQDIFAGNTAELRTETTIFGDINNLLEQQFERLSELEKEVIPISKSS